MAAPTGIAFRAAALLLVAGCAALPPAVSRLAPPLSAAPAVVFVADGAGNFQVSSKMLRKLAGEHGCPLEVVTYEWSHGYGRILSDQLFYQDARARGRELAGRIAAYHAEHPGVPIHVMGHSAGSTVIIAAIEELPPGVIDQAVLLSPSLSACYDLNTALANVNGGLHVFYSRHDFWYLGVVTRLVGSSDRFLCPTSGRVGFNANIAPGSVHGGKLHQRAWQPDDIQLGNNGGHYGNYQPDFMRQYVLPLFGPSAPPPVSANNLPIDVYSFPAN